MYEEIKCPILFVRITRLFSAHKIEFPTIGSIRFVKCVEYAPNPITPKILGL